VLAEALPQTFPQCAVVSKLAQTAGEITHGSRYDATNEMTDDLRLAVVDVRSAGAHHRTFAQHRFREHVSETLADGGSMQEAIE
jgi:hypothetical protein